MTMTFEKFQNRVVIDAKLVAVTPIFVGAKADSFKPGAINGSCVKDAYGRPYIPGSSLKGVLRAFLSDVRNEPLIINSEVNAAFKSKEQREIYGSPQELADGIVDLTTPVEALFGSQVMAGKIKIADAVPYEEFVIWKFATVWQLIGIHIQRLPDHYLTWRLYHPERYSELARRQKIFHPMKPDCLAS